MPPRLIILISVFLTAGSVPLNNDANVCDTPACRDAAKQILESLDNSTDPCDNFYKFACGNAIKKMTIPADGIYTDMFQLLGEEITQQLSTIFSGPIDANESSSITLIKKYYQACMNKEYIEKNNKNTLLDIVKSLGGWPVLEGDSWDDTNFSWTSLLLKYRKLGISTNYFIDVGIIPNPRNSTNAILGIDQLSPGLRRDTLLSRDAQKPYLDLMVNVSVELGADRTRAQKELKESLEFEIKLANISLSPEERIDVTKLLNYMTIKDLQEKVPKTPWLNYIKGLLPSEVQITEDEVILVTSPSYLAALENLIDNTPKRVQANYAIWRAVKGSIPFLPDDIYRHLQTASQLLDEQSERSARWKECTQVAQEKLPISASSLYVRKYFDEDAKKNALEIITYIKDNFRDILKNSEWMDEATRQKALKKVNKIVDHVGYPDELLNDELLQQYYKGLELTENDYMKSSMSIGVHELDTQFKKLRVPVDKNDWTEHANVARVGAYYMILENSIFLPAGILQGVMFNKDRPNYMNFGAMGSFISHEVTHGFDTLGRQLDADGNLNNWWEAETEKRYQDKAECIVYQYGNYTVSQINQTLNGLMTLNENIADNGGVKEAYSGYQAWVKDNGPEPRLPGLDFSPNQLFWISIARNWCGKHKNSFLESIIAVDGHSPNEFRVIGPLSNSKDFAADFKCAEGSKMNPTEKCAVW